MTTTNKFGVGVGDIFETSWGYDQTNVNYYKVVRVTAMKAEVVPIGSTLADGSDSSVLPNPDYVREWDVLIGINREDVKKSKLCTVTNGYKGEPSIVLRSGEHWASKWMGGSRYETPSYAGH